MDTLKAFGVIPADHATLVSALHDYASPNDKIHELKKSGDVIALKRGLYVVSPRIHQQDLSRELIANHLRGPSCVSLESALAHYGLIPERVFAMRSVTALRARKFSTPLGDFDYLTVPAATLPVGVRQEVVRNSYAFLIATPEKALCDLLLTTRNLDLRSVRSMHRYIEEDLRMDMDAAARFDTQIIRDYAAVGKKENILAQLAALIQRLQKA
ncbi:MAG: hypothetical protein LBK99_24245 [Opitutaceae bacterium]|jgi:hypothetical protein|nr:hypothetical protein [Opitutaceae bacterium]